MFWFVMLLAPGAQIVADTTAEPVIGRAPLVAADGTLRLETATGPVTLPVGAWLSARRVGPLPAWPGGPHAVFTSGDRVAGRTLGGDARVVQFVPNAAPDETWALPLTAVQTVWITAPRSNSEAESALPPWAAAKADTLRSGLGQVSGRLLAFRSAPPGLRFRPGSAAMIDVPMAEIRAVTLDPTLARPIKLRKPAIRAVLADGSRLTFLTWELTTELLTGRTTFGVEVKLPASVVIAVESLGLATELVDIKPTVVAEGYVGPALPWRLNRAVNGGALTLRELGGVSTYDTGFGVPARTRLTFALPEGATAFRAKVGVDPAQARPGPVKVRVELDGKPVSGAIVTPQQEPLELQIAVTGGKSLTLVTEFVDGGVGAAANWVGAKLLGG